MHDEVSETENLRKNLAVERMIVEGCDILLDVNQVFVRQGSLVQVPPGRGRIRAKLASFKSERESVRQCFLFSNHMIIATRWVRRFEEFLVHLYNQIGKGARKLFWSNLHWHAESWQSYFRSIFRSMAFGAFLGIFRAFQAELDQGRSGISKQIALKQIKTLQLLRLPWMHLMKKSSTLNMEQLSSN